MSDWKPTEEERFLFGGRPAGDPRNGPDFDMLLPLPRYYAVILGTRGPNDWGSPVGFHSRDTQEAAGSDIPEMKKMYPGNRVGILRRNSKNSATMVWKEEVDE